MSEESPAQNFRTTCLRLFIVSILATAFVGAGTLLLDLDGWWRTVQERVLATCAILTGASFWGLICGWAYSNRYRVLPTISMAFVVITSFTGVLSVWELLTALTSGKIVGTSAILAVASLAGFVNLQCHRMGRNLVPAFGVLFTVIASLIGVLFTWELLDFSTSSHGGGAFKLMMAAMSCAIGCTHLAMLLLMKIQRSYRWVQGAAYYVILGLASLISLLIMTEGGGLDGAFAVRILGVWSIAATAVTLILPVLWFLSRGALDEAGDTAAELMRRIAKKHEEAAALEERLAALPPAVNSPWDEPEKDQPASSSTAEPA